MKLPLSKSKSFVADEKKGITLNVRIHSLPSFVLSLLFRDSYKIKFLTRLKIGFSTARLLFLFVR